MSMPEVCWHRLPDGGCVVMVGGEARAAFSTAIEAADYCDRWLARDRVAARVEQIAKGYHRILEDARQRSVDPPGRFWNEQRREWQYHGERPIAEGNGHIDGA